MCFIYNSMCAKANHCVSPRLQCLYICVDVHRQRTCVSYTILCVLRQIIVYLPAYSACTYALMYEDKGRVFIYMQRKLSAVCVSYTILCVLRQIIVYLPASSACTFIYMQRKLSAVYVSYTTICDMTNHSIFPPPVPLQMSH